MYLWSITIRGEDVVVSAAEDPDKVPFLSVYPNPVTRKINVSFAVTRPGAVEISVYNSQGQKATVLFAGEVLPGAQTISWDDTFLSEGLYIIRMKAPQGMLSTKISVN